MPHKLLRGVLLVDPVTFEHTDSPEEGGRPRGEEGRPDPVPEPLGRGDLQDRAIRGFTWTIINTIVVLPIAFIVNLLVARLLGVVDYGRLAFLTSIMETASGVVMLGVHPALVQFGARAHAQGRRAEVVALLGKTQGFRILVAAPILTLVVALVITDIEPWLKVTAIAFGVVVPAALDGATACLAIENKSAANAKAVLLGSLLTQAAVLVAVLTVAQANVVWSARLIATSSVVIFALFPVAADYRRGVLRAQWPRALPAGFWRFGISTGIAAVLGTLVSSRSEVLVLSWLSDPASVGAFALAFGLATHIYAPAQAMLGPIVPAIAGLRETSPDSVADAFSRVLRGAATLVALLSAIVLPAFATLVPTLYGPSYNGVAPLLLALGITGGAVVIGGGVGAFVLARLSARTILQANILGLIVDFLIAFALIPSLGAWGAVLASTAATGTGLVILLKSERDSLGMPWPDVLRDLAPALIGLLVGAGAWGVSTRVPVALMASALAASVGLVGVVVLLWLSRTGLKREDVGAVSRTLPIKALPAARRVFGLVTFRRS